MGKKVLSKLIYLSIALCFLIPIAIFDSAKGASTPTQPPAPRYGGTMRLSEWSDGVSIGYPPKLLRVTTSMRQAAPAIETLFRTDKTGKPVLWLAAGSTKQYIS